MHTIPDLMRTTQGRDLEPHLEREPDNMIGASPAASDHPEASG
jgi:hypothetical protein